MRLSVLLALVMCGAFVPAFAQTEGRISVGVSVTQNITPDADVASATGVGVFARLNPREGWGAAGAFNWFRADLGDPAFAVGATPLAELRVRPLMAGVSYGVRTGTVVASFSVVGGPSFNKARFPDAGAPAGATIDADNSIAVRPGVGITWTVAPRVAVVGFGGYMINRPDVRYRSSTGLETAGQWNADAVVLSVGVAYSLWPR